MGEREKEDSWQKVCLTARQKHALVLETLRPIEHRSILQSDGVMYCVVNADQWEERLYTLERRKEVSDELKVEAAKRNAWATGLTVLGVSPEQQSGKVVFRPSLLTFVSGRGVYERCQFKIMQRVELEPSRVVAYGPLSFVSLEYRGGEWIPDVECEHLWPRVIWTLESVSE